MTKRIIGLVLALCLIVGLLPMIALADDPHTHTPAGAGTELADQRVNASLGDNGTVYGKYVVQYTCADCGATYTEDVAFGPGLLHYKTAAEDNAATESANYNTWANAGNKGNSYKPRIVMNPGDAPRYFVTKGGHATFTANSYVEELKDADKIAAGEWNIKMEYPVMGDVILTLKGANVANSAGLWLGRGAYGTTANYKIVTETDSTIKQTAKAVQGAGVIKMFTTGTVTFTGPGKLTLISNTYNTGAIMSTGDIALDNADIKFVKEDSLLAARSSNGFYTKEGSITIKDSKLEVVCYCPEEYEKDANGEYVLNAEGKKKNLGYRGLTYSVYAGKDVTIDNSVVSIAASMTGNGGTSAGIRAAGKLTIKNSDVTASHGGYAYGRAIMYGELVLDYTNGYKAYNSGSKFTYNKDTGVVTFPSNAAEFTEITTDNMHKYFVQLVHNCYTANDDFDCTTAATCDLCGKAIGEVLTHVAEPDDGDCTTPVKCANGGCEQIVTPAEAAHTPEADDGDCTTAIKCAKCGTVTTEAKASHTSPADRTSCDQPANCTVCNKALAVGEHTGGTATCKEKATCTVCGEKYGELGDHTGGTATCKDKAKCTVCGEAYGELSTTHVPGEDDKDCSTAVKCTLCGGEAIAAKTHKYTNGLDTTCDNEGCEHTRVVEPKPLFSISFGTTDSGEGVTSTSGKATVQMNAGDAPKYYTTYVPTAEAYAKNSILKATTDTTNWKMKIEYDADGIPTVTLKDCVIDGKYGLLFGGWNAANEGPVKLVLEGENIIAAEYSYKSALQFLFKGDKGGVTIEGPGKLLVSTNCHGGSDSKMGAVNVMKGSLTMNNANLTVLTSEEWGNSFGVVVDGGDFTVNGGSLKVVGYDDSKTTHYEGKTTGYNLNANAMYAGVAIYKTDENATNGNFTVEGGAKVMIAASIAKNSTNPNNEAVMTQGKFTIKDSEVEIALIGKCVDGSKLFLAKPTLEFKDGAYTVTATKTKKATPTLVAYDRDQYTKDVTALAPDESKLVNWAETTSLGSITYFKVVAGGSGAGTGGNTGSGTGTGTGTGSNPNTGDVSILLTAAIALSSAVGFAGVTVLRKKEF